MFSPSTIALMVSEFAGEIEVMLPQIEATASVNPDISAKINAGVDALKNSAAALAQADNAQAGSLIQRISNDVNAELAVVSTIPGLPSQVSTYIRISQIVLPSLLAAAMMFFPPTPSP